MIIGFGYCGSYKSRSQKLSDTLKARNAENENLINRVNSLDADLETTASQLKAKVTEANMLQSALSDLREQVKTVAAEKAKVEQEKLSLAELRDSLKQETEAKEIQDHRTGR